MWELPLSLILGIYQRHSVKRTLLQITIVLICSCSILNANIDEQISAIKNASVEERFKLMNAFKKKLIQMKEKERIDALKKLSSQSNKKQAKMALDELKQASKRNKIKKHIDHNFIDEDSFTNDQEGNDYD